MGDVSFLNCQFQRRDSFQSNISIFYYFSFDDSKTEEAANNNNNNNNNYFSKPVEVKINGVVIGRELTPLQYYEIYRNLVENKDWYIKLGKIVRQ